MSQDTQRACGVPNRQVKAKNNVIRHYLSVMTEKNSNMLHKTVTLIIFFLPGKVAEGFKRLGVKSHFRTRKFSYNVRTGRK